MFLMTGEKQFLVGNVGSQRFKGPLNFLVKKKKSLQILGSCSCWKMLRRVSDFLPSTGQGLGYIVVYGALLDLSLAVALTVAEKTFFFIRLVLG
jgi:hypothetical protein